MTTEQELIVRCETHRNQMHDAVVLGRFDSQCERKATRLITAKNGNQIKLCGYCARGYKFHEGSPFKKIERI